MVNSTASSVTSINYYLSSLNMTFNDLFFNWQIALFLDNPAIGEGKYYFRNMDYTLSPLDYVSEETIHYISVPYYGFHSSLVDFTEKELDITIDNANHKKLGVVTLHYNEDTLIDIRTTLTTNTTINVFCPASTTSVLISIVFIDEVYPTKTGDEGLGEKVSVSLRTIDPYKLLLINPNIDLNDTHLIVEGLNILFINETDIYYSNGEDFVSIKLRGTGTTVEWLLFFDENKGFWRGIWSLSSLLPGVYELILHAQTCDYEIEKVLESLTVPLKINFSLPHISYNNVTNVLTVRVNITIFPIAFIDQIIERAEVKAYLYDDNKEYVLTIILATVDYSQWFAEHYCTKNTLLQGRYYTQIYFIYEGLEDSPHSFPSNRIYLSYHTEESSLSCLLLYEITVTFFILNLVVRMKKRR